MAQGASTIQLPAGYEDAKPIASAAPSVSLPAGYEDATPISGGSSKPTLSPMEMVGAGVGDEADAYSQNGQVGIGVAKGAMDAPNLVSEGLNKIPAVGEALAPKSGIAAAEQLAKPTNGAQSVGKGIEATGEFVLGDEILSGLVKGGKFLELANKYPWVAKVLDMAKDHPWLAKVLQETTKGAAVGAVHDSDNRAKGALIGGTLGAATGTVEGAPDLNLKNPFRQIVEGKGVAQEPGQAAVRAGVESAGSSTPAANAPLVSGNKTIMDDTVADLAKQKDAAYQKIDDVAKFDLKAEKRALSKEQYKLKQYGLTPADKAAAKVSQEAIDDSTRRIAIAEAKLKEAGIDPNYADALNKRWQSAKGVRDIIWRNTAPDGTVKIDSLIRQSHALRFSKYGDRLEQLMGKDGAQQYMDDLMAAQKAGIHAMKVQTVTKWAAALLGFGAADKAIHLVSAVP